MADATRRLEGTGLQDPYERYALEGQYAPSDSDPFEPDDEYSTTPLGYGQALPASPAPAPLDPPKAGTLKHAGEDFKSAFWRTRDKLQDGIKDFGTAVKEKVQSAAANVVPRLTPRSELEATAVKLDNIVRTFNDIKKEIKPGETKRMTINELASAFDLTRGEIASNWAKAYRRGSIDSEGNIDARIYELPSGQAPVPFHKRFGAVTLSVGGTKLIAQVVSDDVIRISEGLSASYGVFTKQITQIARVGDNIVISGPNGKEIKTFPLPPLVPETP